MITELEIKRQLMHIFSGILIVLLLYFDLINSLILFILVVVGFILSFLSKKIKIPVIYSFLKTFDREEDLKKFPGKGSIFYVLGAFLATLFFQKDIAMASIIILALGDSVSRIVGPYGYLKHPFHSEKFLEGIIAGAFTGFVGAMFFVSWQSAAIASTISMLIEGIDLRVKGFKIDDNLTIPLVAGFVMWLLRNIFLFAV